MLLSAAFAWFGVAAKDPNDVILLFSLALGALGMCEGIFWTSAPALEPAKGGIACAFLNTIGNAGRKSGSDLHSLDRNALRLASGDWRGVLHECAWGGAVVVD